MYASAMVFGHLYVITSAYILSKGVNDIYDRIARIAYSKGISIRELERRCEFPYGTIIRWQKVQPSVQKAYKVAQVLGVSLEKLMK